ncbi:MAG: hypothetical protein PHW64_03955 [Sulfuricurvum sp.]|nr:hypothetical protein [Sulfuricurvum sp.]
MKLSLDRNLLILFAAAAAVFLSAGWMLHERALLSELVQERNGFDQSAARLLALKDRWKNNEDLKPKIDFLLNHGALVHQERRQDHLILDYANLTSVDVDKLTGTLLNTPFLIVKYNLTRNANVATLHVEIEQ